MIDQNTIGRLLLETRKITREEYDEATQEARERGKAPYEILLLGGKVSVDELVQAITIYVDQTLLKEALEIQRGAGGSDRKSRPLGSYLERISLLFKMGVLMSSETNMSALVDLLMREAPAIMNAERATIFLADPQSRELYSHVGVGLMHDQIRIPWETGIAGWVYTHGESLNIPDPYKDPRFNKGVDPITGYKTKNLLCVPMRAPDGVVVGAFQVLNKRAGVFTATDLEVLDILAAQAARAIAHAIEWDHLKQRATLLKKENVGLKQALQHKDPFEEIVGTSRAIQEVRSLIRKVAPTETSVLIQGESGTGKELAARAIHRLSLRAEEPLISLNCAAVPAELIETELFGHKKGAFTGSVGDHKGVFRTAHRGTLFLDEIEATSPAMQVKLLRAIQVGEIKPVGESRSQMVDARLIAATNRDLSELIRKGMFREDLYYRINVFPITIPPLRDRLDDLQVLVRHFLDKFSEQTGKVIRKIDPAAMDLLMRYQWPGNIRELENEIERAHILSPDGGSISVGVLSPRVTQSFCNVAAAESSSASTGLKEAVEALEKKMIEEALARTKNNKSVAARSLGLSRQGLINKIHKYGIKDE